MRRLVNDKKHQEEQKQIIQSIIVCILLFVCEG